MLTGKPETEEGPFTRAPTTDNNTQTSDRQDAKSSSDHSASGQEQSKDEIDGAALLDRIAEWIGRFVLVIDPGHLSLLALWVAHTHLVEVLYTTPRLLIDSPPFLSVARAPSWSTFSGCASIPCWLLRSPRPHSFRERWRAAYAPFSLTRSIGHSALTGRVWRTYSSSSARRDRQRLHAPRPGSGSGRGVCR